MSDTKRSATNTTSRTRRGPVEQVALQILRDAIEVFGTKSKACAWLTRPNRACQNETPLSLLATKTGTARVKQILGRIVHGVYS
ncbi:MAG: DUF2384 domain-containing protein [Nitrospira sp.]|nr:DUF2384 domain-containing protein [Nitrospira sp.]